MAKELKDRLAEAMADRHMNGTDLHEVSGVDDSTISRYLSGARQPRINQAAKLAKALGVRLHWLVVGEGPKQPDALFVSDGVTAAVETKTGGPTELDEALRTFELPSDLEPEQASEVVRRVRQDAFKATERLPVSYWHGRLRRLVAEVLGRAKDAPQRAPAEDVDLTQESPEVREHRKRAKKR